MSAVSPRGTFSSSFRSTASRRDSTGEGDIGPSISRVASINRNIQQSQHQHAPFSKADERAALSAALGELSGTGGVGGVSGGGDDGSVVSTGTNFALGVVDGLMDITVNKRFARDGSYSGVSLFGGSDSGVSNTGMSDPASDLSSNSGARSNVSGAGSGADSAAEGAGAPTVPSGPGPGTRHRLVKAGSSESQEYSPANRVTGSSTTEADESFSLSPASPATPSSPGPIAMKHRRRRSLSAGSGGSGSSLTASGASPKTPPAGVGGASSGERTDGYKPSPLSPARPGLLSPARPGLMSPARRAGPPPQGSNLAGSMFLASASSVAGADEMMVRPGAGTGSDLPALTIGDTKAATVLQGTFRGHRARKEIRKQHTAATRVQASERRRVAMGKLRRKVRSIITMQAVVRGWQARLMCAQIRAEIKEKVEAEMEHAAVQLQAVARGRAVRRDLDVGLGRTLRASPSPSAAAPGSESDADGGAAPAPPAAATPAATAGASAGAGSARLNRLRAHAPVSLREGGADAASPAAAAAAAPPLTPRPAVPVRPAAAGGEEDTTTHSRSSSVTHDGDTEAQGAGHGAVASVGATGGRNAASSGGGGTGGTGTTATRLSINSNSNASDAGSAVRPVAVVLTPKRPAARPTGAAARAAEALAKAKERAGKKNAFLGAIFGPRSPSSAEPSTPSTPGAGKPKLFSLLSKAAESSPGTALLDTGATKLLAAATRRSEGGAEDADAGGGSGEDDAAGPTCKLCTARDMKLNNSIKRIQNLKERIGHSEATLKAIKKGVDDRFPRLNALKRQLSMGTQIRKAAEQVKMLKGLKHTASAASSMLNAEDTVEDTKSAIVAAVDRSAEIEKEIDACKAAIKALTKKHHSRKTEMLAATKEKTEIETALAAQRVKVVDLESTKLKLENRAVDIVREAKEAAGNGPRLDEAMEQHRAARAAAEAYDAEARKVLQELTAVLGAELEGVRDA